MGLLDKLKEQASQALNSVSDMASNYQSRNSMENQQGAMSYPPSPQNPVQDAPSASPSVSSSGSNGIYGNYMEHLIEMALADGELTEKEKQVLFKKAEAAGIDLDEFEMVLDARLYEKQKAMKAAAPVAVGGAAPQSNKIGDVRKCPSCGAILESFTTRCPDCGHEINSIGVVSSFLALTSKLEEFDKHDKGNLLTGMFGGEIKRIQKKKQIITNFPIPTAREDLLEFLAMGVPLCQKKGSIFMRNNTASPDYEHNQLASAWRAKLEQVLMKARLAMKEDKATLAEIEKYAQQLGIK